MKVVWIIVCLLLAFCWGLLVVNAPKPYSTILSYYWWGTALYLTYTWRTPPVLTPEKKQRETMREAIADIVASLFAGAVVGWWAWPIVLMRRRRWNREQFTLQRGGHE